MKAITPVFVMIALLVMGCSKKEASPQEASPVESSAQKALPNKCVKKGPSIVFDDEQNQIKHGEEWECYSNGVWMRADFWKDGKRHGKWVHWHGTGKKWKETTYKDGKIQRRIEWSNSGKLRTEEEFRNGVRVLVK